MNIVSLFDLTGIAVRPWAEAGYACYCFDLQHPPGKPRKEKVGKGSITFVCWNSDKSTWLATIKHHVAAAYMVLSFAPCDDLSGCGSKHYETKRRKDPDFQKKAVDRFKKVERVAKELGTDRWVAENPVGVITRLWRKWQYIFHPCLYGGYIPERESDHPTWPEYIPPRDAYEKKTCLWAGEDFVMPKPKPVEPEWFEGTGKDGRKLRFNRQTAKLGGKSMKTKNIRSATPRGVFRAIFLSNRKE